MEPFDQWPSPRLRSSCTTLGLLASGTHAQLVHRVATSERARRLADLQPTTKFLKLNDESGLQEEARLRAVADLERGYWDVVVGAEIAGLEGGVLMKKRELEERKRMVEGGLERGLKALQKRVGGDEGGGFGMIGTQTPMPYRPAPLREADTLFSGSGAGPAVAAGWLLHGGKENDSNAHHVDLQAAKKRAYVEIDLTDDEALGSAKPTPTPAPTSYTRKPAPLKRPAALEDEKIRKSSFLTAKGRALIKAMDGTSDSDEVAHQDLSTTHSTVAKRLSPVSSGLTHELRTPSRDLRPELIESFPIAPSIDSIGYIFLGCADPAKIRGDIVPHLESEYRSASRVRADDTGYYVLFEDSAEGHAKLSDCYEIMDEEIQRGRFFDGNVVDAKLMNWRKPETEVLEEVELGYTPAPYLRERRKFWKYW